MYKLGTFLEGVEFPLLSDMNTGLLSSLNGFYTQFLQRQAAKAFNDF